MLLADHILKPLRSVAPGDDGISRRASGGRSAHRKRSGTSTSGADSAALAAGGFDAAFESGPLATLARFIVTNPEA